MTNIYARDVSHLKTLDPYRLQELYKMHPCAEHVVKKLLVAGEREGAKDLDTDISDCIRTLTRWQAMRAEDAGVSSIPKWATHTLVDGDGVTVFVREEDFEEYHEYSASGDIARVFNRHNYVKDSLKPVARISAAKIGDGKIARYDWASAPDWAAWGSTDFNGSFFWFAEKPFIDSSGNCWNIHGDGRYKHISGGSQCAEWRESLEARP